MERGLIESVRAAVDASPADIPLRLQLAELLLEADEPREALVARPPVRLADVGGLHDVKERLAHGN